MDKNPGIIIIEDHPIMREGLAAYFTGTGRWQVLGKASNLEEAKELLTTLHPDIVLLDIQLEDGWGLDIIPWYAEHTSFAEQTVITEHTESAPPLMAVYSNFDDYAHVKAALGMGVRAYICKRRGEAELENALREALDGKIYIDDTAQKKLTSVTSTFTLLSKREAEILSLVKDGLSNNQIADRLGISRRTVENTLSCVYDKTGIKTRWELERL